MVPGISPAIDARTSPRARSGPRSAEAAADALDLEIACDAGAPRRSREALAAWFGRREDGVVADLRLLVSELVANAVLHGDGRTVRVTARRTAGVVRVSVTSAGARRPQASAPGEIDAVSGRGLRIVDELADRWGTHHHDGSVIVWFELAGRLRERRAPATAR